MLSTLSQLRGVTVWLAGTIVATLLAGVAATAVGRQTASAPPGHLAMLLSSHHAGAVAAHVAASARDELGADRLSSAWSVAVAGAGPLRAVTHHATVRETGGASDEVEVLQFEHGKGVLTAHRTPAGITGLVLLVGDAGDQATDTAAAAYAQDLVTGQLSPLRARFDQQMAAALPPALFTAETAAATAGLEQPAEVAGQIVVRRPGLAVVETYLLFGNGLRRIEMSLAPNGEIAGLYIRPL